MAMLSSLLKSCDSLPPTQTLLVSPLSVLCVCVCVSVCVHMGSMYMYVNMKHKLTYYFFAYILYDIVYTEVIILCICVRLSSLEVTNDIAYHLPVFIIHIAIMKDYVHVLCQLVMFLW